MRAVGGSAARSSAGEMARFRLQVGAGMLASIFSAVCIVLLNKSLFVSHHFNFPVTLTGWHMCFTAATLWSACKLGVFDFKKMPLGANIAFSLLDSVTMGFQNLSLGNNSVSFYQMCKLLVAPCTVVVQRMFFGEKLPSPAVSMALVLLLGGIGAATVSDVQLNPLGAFFGVASTTCVCFVTVLTNTLQKTHELTSFQMLLNVAPVEGIMLLVIGPVWDYWVVGATAYRDYQWSVPAARTVLGTCALAVGVNGATFFLLGKTSPVSYQVMGHLKTVLVLGGGFLLFDTDASLNNIVGVGMAFMGCLIYAFVKDREMRRALQQQEDRVAVGDGVK
uniref:Sugar phosphate transporter domain-containing protein n=1 Tax=Mantoniella antarctica TaxID=81844 RepID=A0A7S0SRB9_9CHLO|mmetsp:Transcript_34347/g.86390  ORF Transcript_34347/g.86390 Transcript_34347/m.86390 type:complete len:334 (+) Transcript_34347:108-1109(+)|eukprot:CAMPEP_0181363318 /NCGR_PEP_ID=MMETSP1106-20121128/8637_1 /TAXON_ID=81844 /ORGANISM="Mantoniella antarctica, Strain SL-175" /LENGTH=333 /DNA_ID=CAMNT_0023477653 /DNA_START=268 /DNA_END=1269 /DNA_ORIENTATION=+